MSDESAVTGGTPATGTGTALLSGEAMGRFDENGVYIPRAITEDDLAGSSLEDAMVGTIVEFEDGDLVEGTVVKIDRDEVLLDIGFKSEGVIPVRELSIRNDVDPSEIVSLGDKVEALVLQKEDKEGRLILSKKRAQYERAWGTIEKLKENDEVVTGPVIEVVKGGLIVDIGLRGFLPASLVELRRVRELQPYVGRTIEAKIIELDRNRNNVVLSRRAWLEETQKEQRGEFLTNLKPGERRRGVVSSVVNFGAFVDLGGMDGLVHVSELSWKHVDHPSSVVSVGDEIEVEVLDVDLSKERISLSLKATQNDPWQEFANSHQVGELVYGRITKLVPFGSFVQVGDGIEGLVHISEMAVHHVDLPEQVVTPGEELWVKIIDIDLQRRRISLSIKQAAEGGEVSEEYREAFGEHAYDAEGNYIGPFEFAEAEFTPETEAQAAWAEYVAEHGPGEGGEGEAPAAPAGAVEAAPAPAPAPAPADAGGVVTETEAGPLTAEVAPEAAAPAAVPAAAPEAAPEAAAPQAAPVAPPAAPAAAPAAPATAPAATQAAPVPPAEVETETEAGPVDAAGESQ
jgi:small subunit ribosomal protein S1